MNNAYFNRKAAEWDDNPVRTENARQIAAAIRAQIPLSQTMTALEFGCGTGLVSREILPMVGKITAIDLSPGMIEQLKQRIEEAGLRNITARCLNLLTDTPDGPVDLIFSAMALHHVPETEALLDTFTAQLNPGGFIALADLDSEDGTFHGEEAGPVHHGFNRNELIQQLRRRGYEAAAAVTASNIHKNGRSYPVFLITAHKLSE